MNALSYLDLKEVSTISSGTVGGLVAQARIIVRKTQTIVQRKPNTCNEEIKKKLLSIFINNLYI